MNDHERFWKEHYEREWRKARHETSEYRINPKDLECPHCGRRQSEHVTVGEWDDHWEAYYDQASLHGAPGCLVTGAIWVFILSAIAFIGWALYETVNRI